MGLSRLLTTCDQAVHWLGRRLVDQPEKARCGPMATPEELASFLIKTAVELARLDNELGPDDESFRDLATCELVDEMPIPNHFADVHEQLLHGQDPLAALSDMFVRQACAYTEAGARACSLLVDVAVFHLTRTGGEAAAQRFFEDVEVGAQTMGAEGELPFLADWSEQFRG